MNPKKTSGVLRKIQKIATTKTARFDAVRKTRKQKVVLRCHDEENVMIMAVQILNFIFLIFKVN